jgi:hypothetical protein
MTSPSASRHVHERNHVHDCKTEVWGLSKSANRMNHTNWNCGGGTNIDKWWKEGDDISMETATRTRSNSVQVSNLKKEHDLNESKTSDEPEYRNVGKYPHVEQSY